ncbi:MAG: nitroreductase family deazaflavin-dependent oxidoreductase [Actinomycetota bacterium]|nr:nitroreductase family deazaflavin-dependent oxidoreductase [Actinomycetota bacterium]
MRNPGTSPAMFRATRVVAALLRFGLPMGPLRLLETTGRRSGERRSTPVALTRHGGDRWIVSPFGDVHWVHNVRADPVGHLVRLRRPEPVTLVEVGADTAAPVIAAFRRSYRAVPFIRPAFDTDGHADVAAFRREATRHPVFRVTATNDHALRSGDPGRAQRHDAPT